jgi:hypothetical protein
MQNLFIEFVFLILIILGLVMLATRFESRIQSFWFWAACC